MYLLITIAAALLVGLVLVYLVHAVFDRVPYDSEPDAPAEPDPAAEPEHGHPETVGTEDAQ
ncbi:MAG: hypothetical protein ACTH1D_01270 [Mycobacteriaceae bacterium]|uniref:hypothetical protein n=1 Tax=Corynebacterium sp. TaxID=1720 RepID=UPI003F9B4C42